MARVLLNTLILLLVSFAAAAQVDPQWLRSWQDAVAARPDRITDRGQIAAPDEPGSRLLIQGQVLDPSGNAAPGVLVHAYHRDHSGYEFGSGDQTTTWRLQGWARSDADGRFSFATIRPAADHLNREPAHLHFTLVSPKFGRQWAPKAYFADDPAAAGLGHVLPVEQTGDSQQVQVTFTLKEAADF